MGEGRRVVQKEISDLFPNHLPEVDHRIWEWPLSSNVIGLLWIAVMNRRCINIR